MEIKGTKKEKRLQLKFLILGEGMIGKSCLLVRYIDNKYKDNYLTTIGIDTRIKKLEINNKSIHVKIIDTSGEERYRSMINMFYKDTDGFLIGLDLTDKYTLEQVNYWIKQVEEKRNKEYPISWVLFGNKCDNKDSIKVKEEDIKNIIEKYNIKYFETSAKTGTNVTELFDYLIKLTLKIKGLLNEVGFSGDNLNNL